MNNLNNLLFTVFVVAVVGLAVIVISDKGKEIEAPELKKLTKNIEGIKKRGIDCPIGDEFYQDAIEDGMISKWEGMRVNDKYYSCMVKYKG